jgi:hypothetical protein
MTHAHDGGDDVQHLVAGWVPEPVTVWTLAGRMLQQTYGGFLVSGRWVGVLVTGGRRGVQVQPVRRS